ncbi:hypothetical protein FPV67DRAFT_74353 [Lyophyllum atratum]|nr:hypothetical protein FPV67DRAFT_74353 [Lyophyllum atratum]
MGRCTDSGNLSGMPYILHGIRLYSLFIKVDRAAALDGKNSPRTRWKRAAFLAGRLRDGNRMLEESGYHADAEQKHLETQHWLELIDGLVSTSLEALLHFTIFALLKPQETSLWIQPQGLFFFHVSSTTYRV